MSVAPQEISPTAMRLVRQLRRRVLSGQLAPGTRLPSVRRLADTTGTGIHAAHQALRRIEDEGWARRSPGGYILRTTAQSIEVAAAQLKHEPPAAITIVSQLRIRTADINLLEELVEGVLSVFPDCSLRTVYIGHESWLGQVRQLLEQDAQVPRETGFLLRSVPSAVQRFFASSQVPSVVIGDAEPDLCLPGLSQDMVQVGRLVGQMLLPCGRAVVICHEDLVGGEVRLLEGFQQAARELGCEIPSPADLYFHIPSGGREYLESINRLLGSARRPAGVFAIRPEFALAAAKLAMVHQIRVPDDLQIIGYPHHPMYEFMHPEITSIGIPSNRELGRRSAAFLAHCMGVLPEAPHREWVPTVVVERGSTRVRPEPAASAAPHCELA